MKRKITLPVVLVGLLAFLLLAQGSISLLSEGVYRVFGKETRGDFVSEVGSGLQRRAIVRFSISGQAHTKTSLRGPGFYELGGHEIIRYFPGQPSSAKEDVYSIFDFYWFVVGLMSAGLALILYWFPRDPKRDPW